jgi:hypothetical protein
MGLAVSGQHPAIEPGQETKLGQLLGQALPFFARLITEARRAGWHPGGRARLGFVQAALAGVAAQPHDIAGQRLASSHRRLTLKLGQTIRRSGASHRGVH